MPKKIEKIIKEITTDVVCKRCGKLNRHYGLDIMCMECRDETGMVYYSQLKKTKNK